LTRPALIDAYDGVLFDLDGVIYLGPIAVPGAAEGVALLRGRGRVDTDLDQVLSDCLRRARTWC